GYAQGTFYKGISYYLGIEKELNKNHSLGLTIIGAPTQRGKSNGSVQEVYDLTGNNFYNPNWGYQNGEKRNSRIGSTNKPIGILRHDWKLKENISLINLVSYQQGYESNTRLDWYNGRDPRPDYYKYLPSAALDSSAAVLFTEQWKSNSKWNQVDWDYMYEVNRGKNETVNNVDGIEGNNVTGARSYYIVQDQRTDNRIFNYGSILKTQIGQRWTINGGLNYQYYNANYYSLIDDLLGGEFFLDIDKFAERDLSSNPAAAQPNLDKPNHIARKGDRYGFDYDMNVRNYSLWMQHVFVFPHFDYFISGNIGQTINWREGNVKNGRFPDNSLGESARNKFLEYGLKGGVTYKIDGRNYLTVNGGYLSQAPLVNNSFISSRTRNSIVKNLVNEKVATVEGSYNYVAPNFKLRLTGYLTNFYDKSTRTAFFNDVDGTFVNFNMTGIGQQNGGVELGSEIKLNPQWKINAVASVGRFVYANNPTVTISNDNDEEIKQLTVYQKGYRVENCPQEAYSVGLSYNSSKFWFITLNANYARMSFLDMNPYRRTSDIANPELVEPGSPAWYKILHEEEFPAAFTLDLFGGKSWKIKKNYINLNVGVNNLLNNTNIKSGGYEQARVYYKLNSTSENGPIDVSKFPPKYFYAYGINYFISLTFRI
ncbi:MAG TPA: TonB-dependent receptor, partial [Saprospiraceae bacterium]|nr:TonB-dependent receptor [Saprospiraceae bacterium]